jgi:hypothetical protein
MSIFYQPDLMLVDGSFRHDRVLEVSDDGKILSISDVAEAAPEAVVHRLSGCALLQSPGVQLVLTSGRGATVCTAVLLR